MSQRPRNLATLAATSLLAMAVLTQAAHAARPDTRAYACGDVYATVQQYKSIVLSTGDYTYDRFVIGRGFCGPTQDVKRALVPTADNPRCNIGYTCIERMFDRD